MTGLGLNIDPAQQPLQLTQSELKQVTGTPTEPSRVPKGPPGGLLPGDEFELPNQQSIPAGFYPRIARWVQGIVIVEQDLDTGRRRFYPAKHKRSLTPQETFRIVAFDKTKPKRQVFDHGIFRYEVGPRGIRFLRLPESLVFRRRRQPSPFRRRAGALA